MVWNKKRDIYWDPKTDIILFQIFEEMVYENSYSAETAFLWSASGYSNLRIQGVQKLALWFDDFANWVNWHPDNQIFEEVKTVYLILKRRKDDGDDNWRHHLKCFKRWWHHQQNFYRLPQSRWDLKHEFDLKIVQSVEGTLNEGDFERAISEKEIRGWEEHPGSITWLRNEDSWRDRIPA